MRHSQRRLNAPNVQHACLKDSLTSNLEGFANMPVGVKYEPFRELIIKDYTYEESPDKLAALMAGAIASGAQAYLQWAEGIVYIPSTAPPETQYEELLQGRVVWLGVTFAPMPKFAAVIRS